MLRMSRRFLELQERTSAWIEVEHRPDGRVVIERDPEAPRVTRADVEIPGRPLTPEEFGAEFGDLPANRKS